VENPDGGGRMSRQALWQAGATVDNPARPQARNTAPMWW
jgi:hypothetical protein